MPVDAEDPQREYDLLRDELASHSRALGETPHCVVLTKADLLPPDADPPEIRAPHAWGIFPISAVTRDGVSELLEALWDRTREEMEGEKDALAEEEWWVPGDPE